MKSKTAFITVVAFLSLLSASVLAGGKDSDTALKQKIVGYWTGSHWAVLYTADGLKHQISTGNAKFRWDVKNGVYYEEVNGMQACDILVLTDKKFVFRFRGGEPTTYRRLTTAEGKLIQSQNR